MHITYFESLMNKGTYVANRTLIIRLLKTKSRFNYDEFAESLINGNKFSKLQKRIGFSL